MNRDRLLELAGVPLTEGYTFDNPSMEEMIDEVVEIMIGQEVTTSDVQQFCYDLQKAFKSRSK